MKKFKRIMLLTMVSTFLFATGCSGGADKVVPPPDSVDVPDDGDKPYIAIISKGFQHQFWQVVLQGAEDAAEEFGVEISFDGPPTESDVSIQVDMLKNAMTKSPDAIGLAALDTSSVLDILVEAKNFGIPVVGFDSGVPNAPEGTIYATASTDNYAAAELAAEMLYQNDEFRAKLEDTSDPIIAVLSQDATADSIIKRTAGFIDKLSELIEADYGAGSVAVEGHSSYEKEATADKVKATILVNIPATTEAANMKSGADLLLGTENVIAIYGSNENAVTGILAATNDGSDFAEGAKFGDIIAVGFDAGKTQKTAVANGWILGSITQDPYQIGYKTVELAVDAINAVEASEPIIDTGAKWYDSKNITNPEINTLIYD